MGHVERSDQLRVPATSSIRRVVVVVVVVVVVAHFTPRLARRRTATRATVHTNHSAPQRRSEGGCGPHRAALARGGKRTKIVFKNSREKI